jgi:ribosomal protein S6--L-glutamate ligase
MSPVPNPKPYILLITTRPQGWASQRFRAAAKQRRLAIRTADPANALLELGPGGIRIRLDGRKIPLPASVIPRLGPGNYENGFALLEHFEAAGIPLCSRRAGIEAAHDTLRTLILLQTASLNVPHTARLISIKDLKIAQKIIPGPPWILKTFTGAMGIGTMLITKPDQLEALAATFWALKQPVLLQEFVRSVDDSIADIRALVVDGKVLGAIRRSARPGEFRANVHRGGTPQTINLGRSDKKIAIRAARAVGLGIAGIDWIFTSKGPVVLEVNATPGFKGFETATGIDVAGAMIDYAARIGGLK